MNTPKWYVEDRCGSLVRCRDQQEAEEIVASNIAKYPSTGPWRVAFMAEIERPDLAVNRSTSPMPPLLDSNVFIRSERVEFTKAALGRAFKQAQLDGPLETALSSPALAICLRNIVRGNQADPTRSYDLDTDGQTVYILPSSAGPVHVGTNMAAGHSRMGAWCRQTGKNTLINHPPADLKRLASGDDC